MGFRSKGIADHTILEIWLPNRTMRWRIIVHEQEAGSVLVELGEDYGLMSLKIEFAVTGPSTKTKPALHWLAIPAQTVTPPPPKQTLGSMLILKFLSLYLLKQSWRPSFLCKVTKHSVNARPLLWYTHKTVRYLLQAYMLVSWCQRSHLQLSFKSKQ